MKAVATMIITMIPLTTTLAGCGSAARVAPPGPLQVLNAAVTMAPASCTGGCGAKQDITLTAKVNANPNNLGGQVRYS
jgi:hypothetical protein